MMSPFLGLSIIIHVFILFLYQTVLFAQKLIFGFGDNIKRQRITVLARTTNERILPSFVIMLIVGTISGLSFFTLSASFQSRPNTIDEIVSTINTVQAATR